MNAFNERFNRTVQEDFVEYEETLLVDNLRLFNKKCLLDYLDRYVIVVRIRTGGINNRTLCQMLAPYLPDWFHMWWLHTAFCRVLKHNTSLKTIHPQRYCAVSCP